MVKPPRPPRKPVPFPTPAQIIDYIAAHPTATDKREVARAFHIRGDDRVRLRDMLRTMEREGLISTGRPKPSAKPVRGAKLPEVAVLDIVSIDEGGEAIARPASWEDDAPPPVIRLAPTKAGTPAPGVGDRILARLAKTGPQAYVAETIRILPRSTERFVGLFERVGAIGQIRSTNRRERDIFEVATGDEGAANHGDLVLAQALPLRRAGPRRARVVEALGGLAEPRAISLIAIHSHGIPTEFSSEALADAAAARPVTLGTRTDLRMIPLVTIDGSDARDFDDAVFAEPDPDAANPGGWHLIVAIADVAHYVKTDSALDREARERGNSVYFPDRVVPMLPEALSNDLCSLRPHEDRAAMAVHMWIDRNGEKLSHRFVRAVIRSAARLTYEQAQKARDGVVDAIPDPLPPEVIPGLYGAFAALAKARQERGTLELELPERQVVIDRPTGRVITIIPRDRLDSHKLIEEFMILANVCAAETLEATRQPCMYRVHDSPSEEKLVALGDFLASLDIPFTKGQVIRPKQFTTLLKKVSGTPVETMVNQIVLRSQAQATYSPENLGHFGLALLRYAHFTSPIRRYADLLVHRGLIRGLKLGDDGLPDGLGFAQFQEIGQQISITERRAAVAEREVVDRFTAAFLADRVGAVFASRVNGVTRFGLFVTLAETGADGLIPIRSLPQDYYHHDEARQRLIGDRRGLEFGLGDSLEVRLVSADVATGGMLFELAEVPAAAGRPPAIRPAASRKPGQRPGGKSGKQRKFKRN